MMASAVSDTGAPVGAARLTVSVTARVGRDRAAEVLGAGRGAWLGQKAEGESALVEGGRYQLDLELRVSDRAPRVAFHKAAYLDVGPLDLPRRGAMAIPISWRAAGLAPLFPVFAGRLRWTRGDLELDGFYAPPGGGIGMVADRLVLNVAARATARQLLERIAAVMRGETPQG
jgi:hypothetical protein